MANDYLNQINKKETNPVLVSLRSFAEKNNVPIITIDGIHFLNQVIQLKNATRVLEIGTAIAYSSINMVLHTNCEVVTIERNEDMYNIATKNIEEANLQNNITTIFQDALEVDETTLGQFEVIFIDAAKAQSINFFNKYKPLLTKNGVIVTDNLLFHDLVNTVGETRNMRQLLRKIDNFNKFVVEQDDFDTYIYEIGDGMSISIKK